MACALVHCLCRRCACMVTVAKRKPDRLQGHEAFTVVLVQLVLSCPAKPPSREVILRDGFCTNTL